MFSPLHKNLAGILSRMPNDGTFDQDAARRRCREKAVKYNCAFGYDLSAATDRLPIKLQVDILAGLFGRDTAEA